MGGSESLRARGEMSASGDGLRREERLRDMLVIVASRPRRDRLNLGGLCNGWHCDLKSEKGAKSKVISVAPSVLKASRSIDGCTDQTARTRSGVSAARTSASDGGWHVGVACFDSSR